MSTTPRPAPHVRREFFGPRDNFPLSPQDFTAACELCDTMVGLRDGRRDYLDAHGLDAKVYLPAHMWGGNFVASNFGKIAKKDLHTISHLRCLTYNFTGYSLLTMAACENTPEVLEVPADADAIIRGVAGRAADATVDFVRSTQAMPRERIVTTPRMFGESGWDVDGTIVNFDTWSAQQRINALHGSGVLDFVRARAAVRGHARVLEIGAGYGNLAYNLHRMLGPVDYTVVDLPESMIYSSVYLSTVLPQRRCTVVAPGARLPASQPGTTFVANHLLEEVLPQIGEVDLVINVMSLSEMSPVQVAYYGNCVSELIGADGVFFEQNYLLPGVHTDIVTVLGGEFAHGALIDETEAPHRGRGTARLWANGYCGELWDRGGVRPIRGVANAKAGRALRPARAFAQPTA
jgi:putative sugar O-methyltransferase